MLLLVLMPLIGNCKKTIEIPHSRTDSLHFKYIQKSLDKYNLEDLSLSEDSLRIRIWMGANIVDIKASPNPSANLILSIQSNEVSKSIVKSYSVAPSKVQILCDSLIHKGIVDLAGDQFYGIDGRYYLFEVATRDQYRLYSYWSPDAKRSESNQQIVKILSDINTLLDIKNYQQMFYNSLESGTYRIGMSTVRKDQLLSDTTPKSSLYSYIEKKMREELGIDENTNYFKYPLLLVDNQICFLKEINNKEYNQVKSITVLPANEPSKTALYGANGINGVIIVETI